MNKRILVISGGKDNHILRFLQNLDRVVDNNLTIDLYAHDLYSDDNIEVIKANKVYTTSINKYIKRLNRIPKIRTVISSYFKYKTLRTILKSNKYDLINIHQIPYIAILFINLANRNGIKTMLTPWGSDILRAPKKHMPFLQKAFDKTDYVSGDLKIGFSQKIKKILNVDNSKFRNLEYGSDVISEITNNKGIISKEKMAKSLNLPSNRYYITCGYNASPAQRHAAIFDAIYKNKSNLPSNYLIIVPLSYGAQKDIVKKELEILAKDYALEVFFVTDYLSTEHVAYLRLITDLFIHIQTTDAYNASLQEMLIAGAQCINGKWLSYPTLETNGYPYHICEELSTLPKLLNDILKDKIKKIPLHPDTVSVIEEQAWEKQIIKWREFYERI